MFLVIITAVPATFSLFANYSYNGSRASGRQVEHDGGRELAPHNASDVLPTKVKPFAPNHACTSIIHFPIILVQLLREGQHQFTLTIQCCVVGSVPIEGEFCFLNSLEQ